MAYDPGRIEPKWQGIWRERRAFATPVKSDRPSFYVLDMFPYPSGHGLHVGHLKGYVASDVIARTRRMQGYDVLHPMGWDSFGLPTERQAERDGIAPAEVTERNVATFRRQLDLLGFGYDWERELATSDPAFYRWTQWIFLVLFERGLAYQADVEVNWCPALGTVLANEEVKDGVYIETGDPVEKRLMRQWMLRITAYADRLLEDLEGLDWPEEVKELQRNWIGRREGARIRFDVSGSERSFEVFSTRPETLFGCSFCALAPEHELVAEITTPERRAEVERYVAEAAARDGRDADASDAKTGVFTGAFAVNPVDGREVPVWVADYVLIGHGTGAVFGCPAHDERDFEFARTHGLEIRFVVDGGQETQGAAWTGEGTMTGSGFLDGLSTAEAKRRIALHLAEQERGGPEVVYNLRDWLFSRQRYWGEPIPVVHGPRGEVEPVPVDALPVLLPEETPEMKREPGAEPRPPLAAARDWVRTELPSSGEPAERETNVMPQWAGSCWYYLRFLDPRNERAPWDPEVERAWMPVDLYVGGIEHATLHLLYARFWHKVLHDAGHVSTSEPFQRLFNQGMVHARSFRDAAGRFHYPHEVVERDGEWFTRDGEGPLQSRVEKMSKSRYNVVTPESVVEEFGADSLRLYEVFMGPLEDGSIWQTDGLAGMRRFLDRAWRLYEESLANGPAADEDDVDRLLHQTIRKVTHDVEALRPNTAVSQMMIFVNEATKRGGVSRDALGTLVRLLSPFAPHVCEEMWEGLGGAGLVLDAAWPVFDPARCVEESVTFVVQVNGKLRERLEVPRGSGEDELRERALACESVQRAIGDKQVVKTVFVPDRLLNVVVR